MKIWTLTENTASRCDLASEHGLSLYIETGTHKILFDAGQSPAFAENAKKLDVDLAAVDMAVLSHGHYDHGGGLETFLRINQTAPVYMSRYAFEPHYNAVGKYIGLDSALADCARIRFVDDEQKIADNLTLFSCNDRERPYPADTAGLTLLEKGAHTPEDFRHEQYLLIEECGRRVLISGCSHKGILNIMEWFRPDVLVGGFHFMKIAPDSELLTDAARRLREFGCEYYTGHCTGLPQYEAMKEILGDQLHYLSTGTVVEILR